MLIALLALLLPELAEASSFERRHWSMDDGLPQSTVTSMAQSPVGLLVMGTFGGLARFDGISFEVWDGSVGELASIRVTAVDVDGDGITWFGTQDGSIYRMDLRGRVQLIDAPHLGVVWDVAASEGEVWWCTEAGVYRLRDGVLTLEGEDAGWRVARDGERVAWIARDVVYWHQADRTTAVHRGVDLLDVAWHEGELLVGGRRGLFRVDADGSSVELDPRGVEHIAPSDDDVWLAYAHEVWTLHGRAALRVPEPVRSLAVDREGGTWVGATGGGLYQLQEQAYEFSDLALSTALLPLAAGGFAGAMCDPNTGHTVVVHHRDGPDEVLHTSEDCIQALADVSGDLWMGRAEEVVSAATGQPVGSGLRGQVLAIDQGGEWVGTAAGLFRRRGDRWAVEPGIPGPVAAVVRGPEALWVGAADGVYRHDGAEWTAWNGATGTRTTPVRDVWPTDGGAWAGTYGSGLLYVADDTVRRVTTREGLAENVVSRLLPDEHGAVWLLGNRGVSRVVMSELDALREGAIPEVRARLFPVGEGSGGNQPSGALIQGDVVMPLVGGIVRFDLDAVQNNEVPPIVVMRQASAHGEDLLRGGPVDHHDALRVAYTLGTLSAPSLARFRYQLDDGPWVEVGSTRELSWQALPPGRHVLRIVGANEDGVESAIPHTLAFQVPYAWHERWSVRGIIALIFVGFGFLLQRSRILAAEAAAARLRESVVRRKRAEDLAHQRGAYYRRLFDAVAEGLLLCAPGGAVVEANPAAIRMFQVLALEGVSSSELLGTVDEEGTTRCRRPNGTTFPAAVSRFELQGGTTLVTVRDVTTLARASEAQRLEAIGRLAGGVAHDVNNLLTAIAGVGVVLREDLAAIDAPSRTVELIDDLDQCVDRGGTLTRELMAFGRRQMLAPQRQSAKQVLRRLTPLLERAAQAGSSVSVHLCEEELFVTVDASQLELAVLNLVLNGLAALEGSGEVQVRLRPEGEMACIEVADDGDGIPADILPHIYEPFFTTKQRGTGLGLPSVHGFVAQSGGRLTCETEEGVGTIFRILLPLGDAATVEPTDVTSEPSAPHVTQVLVCDDEPAVLAALDRMLRAGCYQTTAINDSNEAAKVDPHSIDLLVTDVSMPGLAGPELARALRERRPDLPVVYVSGFTEDMDLSTSPGPLVHKPFTMDTLLSAVKKALEPSG